MHFEPPVAGLWVAKKEEFLIAEGQRSHLWVPPAPRTHLRGGEPASKRPKFKESLLPSPGNAV